MAKNNNENVEPDVKQPSLDAQRLYMAMVNNDPDEVGILRTKKKYKIRWLKNGQLEKLTRLLIGVNRKKVPDGANGTSGSYVMDAILEDAKLACKAAAIIILDGYWKLKLRYWLLWRWFYYVKEYDNIQLEPILEAGKKKVPQVQFFKTIISLTEAKDSLMRMRVEEVEAILREQSTEQPLQTESSASGS